MTGRADAGLHFLLLAFKNRFVDERGLLAAYDACQARPGEPAERVLRELGMLDAAQVEALGPLVAYHLRLHGHDREASLAALGVPEAIRSRLDTDRDGAAPAAGLALASTEPGTAEPWAEAETVDARPEAVADGGRFERTAFHRGGGLGMVWRAKDRQLHREVALKEIRPDRADEPDYRAMFQREMEITGRLEHPGVVPVYACGEDEEGRLYYAMRFIEGRSLREAIDEFHAAGGRLSWHDERFRALLRRFLAACDPIAFAHAKGVIHRDIKPDNILLGPYGETLVVDWGLAKCLAREAGGGGEADGPPEDSAVSLLELSGSGGPTLTHGRVVGTPAYMPPEQAGQRADEVLAWSDVYSLGATLYALLVGRPAFAVREADREPMLAMWRRARAADPDPEEEARQRRHLEARWREAERRRILSDVQGGRFLRPSDVRADVPPALEAICLKAMALRPADRYADASALAADLGRWLDDRPVSVHRDAPTVRFARWARRNRGKAAAAAAFLVMSVIGLGAAAVGLSIHNRRVDRERALTERSLTVARQTASALMDPLDDADFGLFHPTKAVALLRDALAANQTLLTAGAANPEVRATMADIERRMGNLGRSLGFYDRPVALGGDDVADLEAPATFYAAALRRLEAMLRAGPADAGVRRLLRRTLLDRGELERISGSAATARALFLRVLDERPRSGAGAAPGPLDAEAHLGLARLDLRAGADGEAFRQVGEALAALGYGPAAGAAPPPAVLPLVVEALTIRAVALRRLDRAEEAVADARRALLLVVGFEKADSRSTRSQDLLARTVVDLAPITGEVEALRPETLRNLTEAMKRLRTLSVANRYNWQYSLCLARAYIERGEVLLFVGPWTSAESRVATSATDDAVSVRKNLLERLPVDRRAHPSSRRALARAWALQGRAAAKKGEAAAARVAYGEAITLLGEVVRVDPGQREDVVQLERWTRERDGLAGGP
jgi:serine/threonine protein kinase